jgi:hypothetical protein
LATNAVSIVLLLGSYDKQTKNILERLKEEIAKVFGGKVFAFLLDNLEIYITNQFEILAEIEKNHRITLYFFENSSLQNVQDLPLKISENPDQKIYNYLNGTYGITKFEKKPIANKYDLLTLFAAEIFLIRHKAETRGGEYVELMHVLFSDKSEKLWFFKNTSIVISSMLEEYLDMFRVKIREYQNLTELKNCVTRIVRYSVER